MNVLRHFFSFDPTYGYSYADLRHVQPPEPPPDFHEFWENRYQRALTSAVRCAKSNSPWRHPRWEVCQIAFRAFDGIELGGWLLLPKGTTPRKILVFGHGYGGREEPDWRVWAEDAAILYHFCRGIGLSRQKDIPEEPMEHVLVDIENRDHYILGLCVEDTWAAIGAALELFPELAGHLGYVGVSFSGGIGAMATAFDPRIRRCLLEVPSFGHQALRLTLPTNGSGQSVRQRASELGENALLGTLRYYDAAIAALKIQIPTLCACALFDPSVAPPGQWAVHNAVSRELRKTFVLPAGHFDFAGKESLDEDLVTSAREFFADL